MFFFFQSSMQFEWNLWKHYKNYYSFGSMSSMQMLHSFIVSSALLLASAAASFSAIYSSYSFLVCSSSSSLYLCANIWSSNSFFGTVSLHKVHFDTSGLSYSSCWYISSNPFSHYVSCVYISLFITFELHILHF